MTLVRKLWNPTFRDVFPPWPCPTCKIGRLRVVSKSLVKRASADFKTGQEIGYADPGDEVGTFTTFLDCIHCYESVAVAGRYSVDIEGHYSVDAQIELLLSPVVLVPPPPIIELPDALPTPVANAIAQVFLLFWSDSEACANRIRSCVELILTRIGIPRTRVITKRGTGVRKRERLKLHTRIELLAVERPDLAQTLLAIKWIGNEGSHESIPREAVLDALEMLEHAVELIWGRRQKRVRRMVREVNRRKGPR
jgi:hypothetical protein